MKALQIALLVFAGAISGAVVMKVWRRPHPALQPAGDPAPVVAQAEKPSPVAEQSAQAAEPAPATSSETAEPKPENVPAMAPPTHVAVRPPARGTSERPANRPSYTTPRISPVPPAAPERVAGSRDDPGRPAATPDRVAVVRNQPRTAAPAMESRSSGAGTRTYPEEVSVPVTASAPAPFPAPLPEARQENPAPPANPPARMEQEKVTPVPPSPPEPHRVTLNAGMPIPVRLVDGLSTERNRPGDVFTATLVQELVADEFVIAERGARVEGRVVAAGRAGLTVQLIRLHTSDGQTVAIRTDSFEQRADPASGGGRVSAGGSIVTDGAGGATGGVWLTRNRPAILPSDTRITFRLGVPVRLTERTQ